MGWAFRSGLFYSYGDEMAKWNDFQALNDTVDWDRLLSDQIELTFEREIQLLEGSPEWQSARRVLDAGCGNGLFLRKLAARYPEKSYTGVDLSEALIARAEDTLRETHVDLMCGDFFALDRDFDFVFARAVAQHLPDLRRFVRHLPQLVSAEGGALILDRSDDEPYQFWPVIAEVSEHLQHVIQKQIDDRRGRRLFEYFRELISEQNGLEIAREVSFVTGENQADLDLLDRIFDAALLVSLTPEHASPNESERILNSWVRWRRTANHQILANFQVLEIRHC